MMDLLARRARRRGALLGLSWSGCFTLLGVAALGQGCDDDGAAIIDGGGGGQSPGGAGGGGDADSDIGPSPALRDALTLADDDLAEQALELMGSSAVGGSGSCSSCHALGRPTLTRWSRLSDAFATDCLDDTQLSSVDEVDATLACFRSHAQTRDAFAPADFGIYAAAAHLPWFSFVFEHGTLDGDWRENQADFVTRVGMPRAGAPLTQEQFDVIAEWFARGLPRLFDLIPEDSGQDCTPSFAPSLTAHIQEMAEVGWRAQNEQIPLLMFGCADGQQGADCLSDYPLASDTPVGESWGTADEGGIRILYDNSDHPSNYWSRSSPDGRYFASGLVDRSETGFSGQFLDLQREELIGANFDYDPTFFPDNSGFLIQRGGGSSSASPGGATNGGADRGDVAVVCNQGVLADDPTEITGGEDQCIELESQIGLYQQLAKSTDGEDYWVVFGSYDGDNGGFRPVLDNPSAPFESSSRTTLTPMINQGSTFEAGAPTRVATPLQGDPMLSPSGRLLVTRLKGRERQTVVNGMTVVTAEQSGYALHLVSTSEQDGAWSAELEDVGRVCMQGGKAVISYDERWMVFHHYVTDNDATALGFPSADDPDFDDYRALGASNLILVDLLDGSARTITNVDAGQYALFPHFRSDGWIYFVVRSLDGSEYFAASDAALLLEGASSE